MQNIAVHGTGRSPWEATVLVETIEQVYFAEQAREQGGLLSQEDLAEILMCDVRTIRRDIESLRQREIVVATRGQVRDIGPGVTHRGIAVRLWLEGKEPVEIARHINHSVAAVKTFVQLYKQYQHKPFFKQRIGEIELVGSQYHMAQDEKKARFRRTVH